MEAGVSSAEDLADEFLKDDDKQIHNDIGEKYSPTNVTEELVNQPTVNGLSIPDCDKDSVLKDNTPVGTSSSGADGSQIELNTRSGVVVGRTRQERNSLPPSISQYSSSSEDTVSIKEVPQVRRRKKRKRHVGDTERKTRQKMVWIEEALRSGDKDRLGQLAVREGGLINDEVIFYFLL